MSHEPGNDDWAGDGARSEPRSRHDDDPSTAAPDLQTDRGDEIECSDSLRLDENGGLDQVGDGVDGEIVEPEVQRAAERAVNTVVRQQLSYRGPIPPASELKAYDAVLPGAAERILHMAEKALDSQVDVDTTLARGDVESARRGQWQSTVVVLVCVGAALTAAILGYPWPVVAVFMAPGIFEFGSSLVRAIREPERHKADGNGD